MPAKKTVSVPAALLEKLTERDFLQASSLSARKIRMLTERGFDAAVFKRLYPVKSRVSCAEVLTLCEGILDRICETPPDGWMKFTYDFVCRILYPDAAFARKSAPYKSGAYFYLAVLRFFFDEERAVIIPDKFRDFTFLTAREAERFESRDEYERFKRVWHSDFVYEMMRLNDEVTTFKTLEHIAGVHYVAMFIGDGLSRKGVPIDLTLLSAASAGHDIGKFGCKPGERVPYLHYYYTDRWFARHGIDYAGHIAANHSTWDLEPDNISVESLVLIYADFRVKQARDRKGNPFTHISTLDAAFGVILEKLDNVDEAKLKRYKLVYSKLRDFETYMHYLGVNTEPEGQTRFPAPMPEITLRDVEDSVRSLTLLGVSHNISVMHRMAAERRFGNFLEAARSEKNWKNLSAYLNIFDRYIAYTNSLQKKQTLNFLYELLMHREGAIRAESARLMGKVIAQFNYGYRKQCPEGIENEAEAEQDALWKSYLDRIITPDYRLTDTQQRRIRYHLKNVLASVLGNADEADIPAFLSRFLSGFRHTRKRRDAEAFALLDAIEYLPMEKLSDKDLHRVSHFVLEMAKSDMPDVSIAAWRAGRLLVAAHPEHKGSIAIARRAQRHHVGNNITRTFLKYRILSYAGLDTSAERHALYDRDVISDIFLDNLKTATPWIVTAVNIRLLANHLENGPATHKLHIAAHLTNLVKAGEYNVIRQSAGEALIGIMHLLRPDERNEVIVELMRGLDMGEREVSRFIPTYLGESALWLPPDELKEVIRSVRSLLAHPSDHVAASALDTIGVMIANHPAYRARFQVDDALYEEARDYLFSILLRGLASYRPAVRQEAMQVVGRVFASKKLTHDEKYALFATGYGKLLYLLSDDNTDEITLFYRANALSEISRFITDRKMRIAGQKGRKAFPVRQRKKVAFFPGTFDPFTLSHEGIAKEIRDLGYEVFLAIDEFSWSKKTQPHLIRRRIIDMTVADEYHISLFPDKIPVNIANPADLKRLREVFRGREVYIVVGSDVVAGASAYREAPQRYSIHKFNHIVFRRAGEPALDSKATPEILSHITGRVQELELKPRLLDISSMMIRNNIDLNRDISNLIDPMVQEYIYHNGLYLREPEYKAVAGGQVTVFEETGKPDYSLLEEIGSGVLADMPDPGHILVAIRQSGDRLLLLRNMLENHRLVGFLRYRVLSPDKLFSVLGNVELADDVRRRTSGDVLLISGIYTTRNPMISDPEQFLVSEAIARSLPHGCSFALFYPEDGLYTNEAVSAILRQGFLRAEDAVSQIPLYLVDMHAPLFLLQNMGTTIKEPFASNARILQVLDRTHRRLQEAMAGLYPGQLVLSVSAATIYPRLMEKITEVNEVPREQVTPRVLGRYMCVPYGKILRDRVIPNTVTKTLHTDKVFPPDIGPYSIEAFQNYQPLENQVRMIKSFNRPVILIDDILHRGGRFEVLAPRFQEEQIRIKKVILGILSGYGRDTMALKGVDVDCVYFLPNLRQFFMESTLYPFIGGDTVRRKHVKVAGLSPSINMILPYTRPLMPGVSNEALFRYSACCIENARDIFLALEEEYRTQFGRNLTLERLSEAVLLPLCPDRGECINYDPSLSASVYLENDLQMLYRTQ